MELSWWRIVLDVQDADESVWELAELAPAGFEVLSPSRLAIFLQGDERSLQRVRGELAERNYTVESVSPVPHEPWVQRCKEVWTPVEIGRILIVPQLGVTRDWADLETGSGETRPPSRHANILLRLVPGEGFGTGHHASTAVALSLLQAPLVAEQLRTAAHGKVLDLGTGSGVLAIAAALLYGVRVDAIEIEAAALANAQENVTLNPAATGLTLRLGDMQRATPPYQLILANLYAEVLAEHESAFASALPSGGHLIMAGIAEEKVELVCDSFAVPFSVPFAVPLGSQEAIPPSTGGRWRICEHILREGWIAMLLERR